MGVLALASCVVLSGCGDKKEDPKIVIKDLPTNLVEGNSIDLKDYITVSGGSGGGYSINFDDESFEKITMESETKITLNELGNVVFKVDYSGISQEGTLVVGSRFLSEFVNGIKNAGLNYGVMYEDSYEEMHFENYGEKYIIDGYYEDSYGYLEGPDGIVYSFDLAYDEEDNPIFHFSLTGYEPASISEVSKELSLPTSGYVLSNEVDEKTGESYQLLTLEENDEGIVRNIFLDYFNWDEEDLDYVLEVNAIEITSFQVEEFLVEDEETGETYSMYGTYGMVEATDSSSPIYGQGEQALDVYELMLDENLLLLERKDVQTFIDNKIQPESSYSLNVDAISKAVDGVEGGDHGEFQITYSANWYKDTVKNGELIRGKTPLAENPFVEDEDADSYYIHDHFNFMGSFNAYVSSDKTMVDVLNAPAYGLAENKGPVEEEDRSAWNYSYNSESGKYEATTDTGFHIFDDAIIQKYYNYEFLSGKPVGEYGDIYSEMFINTKEYDEVNNTCTYTLSSLSCYSLFFDLFGPRTIIDGSIPADDDWKPGSYKTLTAVGSFIFSVVVDDGVYLSDMFDVVVVESYDVDGETLNSISFEFSILGAVEGPSGYAYYEYVMTAVIDFTQCNIPEFDVVFPAAE